MESIRSNVTQIILVSLLTISIFSVVVSPKTFNIGLGPKITNTLIKTGW